jgi:CHASE2 domain-containing sensor protein
MTNIPVKEQNPKKKSFRHRAGKIHGRLTKYLYERDTIFATAWVFIFILAVKFLPMPNIHFLDPIEIALEDFDFNDMAYSKLGKSEYTPRDTNIVIINIGEADREGLAMLINTTAELKAKVIGLDVLMDIAKDPHKDSLLKDAIDKNSNLIIASRFVPGKGKEESAYSPNFFSTNSTKEGYANFFSKEWATVRVWNPFMKNEKNHDSLPYQSFVTSIVEKYDPVAFEKLKKRKEPTEIINYTRKIKDPLTNDGTRKPSQYQLIEGEDMLMEPEKYSEAIKGRIALLGYINFSPENIEDKKYTPMNEEFAGKSVPDMNGVVVHANIISMVLEKNFIKKLPLWISILIAILIGWLHMSLFIHYYLENHIWFHLVAKFAQLISAIIFVYLGIYLFGRFRIKLDMTLTIVVIVLAVDIIYFYEAFAVWLHRKFGFKTVFHLKHH